MLIGLNDAGKTMYGAQLLGRILTRGQGALRATEAPGSYEPFYSAWRLLASEGRTAQHTARDQYGEIEMNLIIHDRARVKLAWPDYGGEQIRSLAQHHGITTTWQNRARDSLGWIVMLRLSRVRIQDDIVNRPGHLLGPRVVLEGDQPNIQTQPDGVALSDQAILIEIFQILLYLRAAENKMRRPPLTILLSCWDELAQTTQDLLPIEALCSRAPLVGSYVQAQWPPEDLAVYGVSALGQALSQTIRNDRYAHTGPESAGFIVDPDGRRHDDLTLPLASALLRAQR